MGWPLRPLRSPAVVSVVRRALSYSHPPPHTHQDPTLNLERCCLAALQQRGLLSPAALLQVCGLRQLPAHLAPVPGEPQALAFMRFMVRRPHLFGYTPPTDGGEPLTRLAPGAVPAACLCAPRSKGGGAGCLTHSPTRSLTAGAAGSLDLKQAVLDVLVQQGGKAMKAGVRSVPSMGVAEAAAGCTHVMRRPPALLPAAAAKGAACGGRRWWAPASPPSDAVPASAVCLAYSTGGSPPAPPAASCKRSCCAGAATGA